MEHKYYKTIIFTKKVFLKWSKIRNLHFLVNQIWCLCQKLCQVSDIMPINHLAVNKSSSPNSEVNLKLNQPICLKLYS